MMLPNVRAYPPWSDGSVDVPLSFNQEARLVIDLWSQRRGKPRPPFHSGLGLRWRGPLDVASLERALNEIVRRHDALRTRITLPDSPATARLGVARLSVVPTAAVTVRHETVEGRDPREQADALQAIAASAFNQPFDYLQPPLVRPVLVRMEPEEHVLIVVVHHLVCDGWSLAVVRRELEALYGAMTSDRAGPPALSLQYADFARWEREQSRTGGFSRSLAYWSARWKEWMPAMIDVRDLPLGTGTTPAAADGSARHALMLAPVLHERLRAFAKRCGVTLYIVCFAAFQLLLHGYTGRTRIALWTQFSNRRRLAFQPVIGFFANPHIVGVDLSANPTATQVIGAVRTAMLEAFEHQELPLSLLLDAAMAQNTGLAQHPALGAAHLQFDLGRSFSTSIGALQIVPEALAPGPTELALQVHAAEQEGGLMLTARGRSSWLRPDAVHRVLRNLQDVLDLMSRAPETPASQFRTLVER